MTQDEKEEKARDYQKEYRVRKKRENEEKKNLFNETNENKSNINLKSPESKVLGKLNMEKEKTNGFPISHSKILDESIEQSGFNPTKEEVESKQKLERLKLGVNVIDVIIRGMESHKDVFVSDCASIENYAAQESLIKLPPKFLQGLAAHKVGNYVSQQAELSFNFMQTCNSLCLGYLQDSTVNEETKKAHKEEMEKSSVAQQIMSFVKKQLEGEQQ